MNEIDSFKKDSHLNTPEYLDKLVINFVKKELIPNKRYIFIKLLIIQTFIGIITMTFCPQFDLSLTNNYELFHYFHYNYGPKVCMMICGTIFMGSGAILASHILTLSELKIVIESKILFYFSLLSIYLIIFMVAGAKLYLNLLPFWITGAFISSLLLLEFNKIIRINLIKSLR